MLNAQLGLSEELLHFQTTVKGAVQKYLSPLVAQMDREDVAPPKVLPMLQELGLLTLCHPESAGGPGLNPVACCIATEALAYASPAVAVMVVANWATINVLAARRSSVTTGYLNRWVERPILGSYCLTEPRGGSDAGNLATTATRYGDRYRLNGTKCYITNGGLSSVYVIIAATARGGGHRGTTAFVADANTPGLKVSRLEDKMGTRGSPLAEIQLDDMEIPTEQRVGEEGEGLALAMESQNVSRVVLAASCVGLAQAALDHAHAFTNQREAFGRRISDFQGLQFKLADMATRIEAARSLVYRTALVIKEQGEASLAARKLAAMSKLFASDVAMDVTVDAVQLFGGAGYIKGNPCEMLMRDAKVFQIFAGTNEIQRRAIFKTLQAN